mgnify:FL=1
MGEKLTRIYFGVFKEDIGFECPSEDGWDEGFHSLPEAEPIGSYGKGLRGARFGTSYESGPAWMGFQILEMEYGDTWVPEPGTGAQAAWTRLRQIALERSPWSTRRICPRATSSSHTTSECARATSHR